MNAPQSEKERCAHDKKVEGQCSRCRKCLECCGRQRVEGSCAHRSARMSPGTMRRSVRSYDGYWRSVEAGRTKR